jgi:voltage-gated potassium channel
MRALAGELQLAAWEQGVAHHDLRRAVTMLSVAPPGSRFDELTSVPIAERNVLLLRLHELNFGPLLDVFATCPQCAAPRASATSLPDCGLPGHSALGRAILDLVTQTAGSGRESMAVRPRLTRAWVNPELRLPLWEKRTEWPLAIVALAFLAAYSIEVLAQPTEHVKALLESFTWCAYVIFVIDYVARLLLATDRLRWFFRHLLDLAIVALPLLRPLRLLRLLVLVSALQKAIGGAIRGRVVIFTGFSVVLLVYCASLAILETERPLPGANIKNFGDAVWWSITTVTTAGSDLQPTTGRGRVIAVLLMLGGISLIGIVTATMASWIVQRVASEDTAHQAATAAEIDSLRTGLENHLAAMRDEIRNLTAAVSRDPEHVDADGDATMQHPRLGSSFTAAEVDHES